MLRVDGLHVYYGDSHVLQGVSLEVRPGEVVCLLGRNGAGKSTTLRGIVGVNPPKSGRVNFKGQDITARPVYETIRRGLAFVPEDRRIFPGLTVNENLNMGAYTLSDKKRIEEHRLRVFTLFPRLKERRNQLAGTLSGGEQQMLAIGRALMSDPKILLLDEPSLGLAPLLVKAIFDTVREINQAGVTILLVEQNARAALKLANKGYVLETGSIALSGPAERLLADERVRKAYLGES